MLDRRSIEVRWLGEVKRWEGKQEEPLPGELDWFPTPQLRMQCTYQHLLWKLSAATFQVRMLK